MYSPCSNGKGTAVHTRSGDKATTDRFSYPLSARDATYIRTQEKSTKIARRKELQSALQQTQQSLDDNHLHRKLEGNITRKGKEDVTFISQNARSIGLGNWPQNKDKINTWFNAWKQELTQHGLTVISIQETRLQDKAMI